MPFLAWRVGSLYQPVHIPSNTKGRGNRLSLDCDFGGTGICTPHISEDQCLIWAAVCQEINSEFSEGICSRVHHVVLFLILTFSFLSIGEVSHCQAHK